MTNDVLILEMLHKMAFRKGNPLHNPRCCCFYCKRTFLAAEIEEYAGDGEAICPHCGVDSVLEIGEFGVAEALLEAMCRYWFAKAAPEEKHEDG